jgi:hypothetical protein
MKRVRMHRQHHYEDFLLSTPLTCNYAYPVKLLFVDTRSDRLTLFS